MKKLRYLVGILLLIPFATQAGSLCTFTTECYEDEPCQPTEFQLGFRAGTGGPNEMELVSDAETIGVAVGGTGEFAYLAGLTSTGFHVLTLTRSTGAARYTNHIGAGPQTVSYLGSCEVTE